MKQLDIYIRWRHRKTGDLYIGVFHSEEDKDCFIRQFILPRGHQLESVRIDRIIYPDHILKTGAEE